MKVIRQELFAQLSGNANLPTEKYLKSGRCAYSASTGSRRLYIGETTRQYWTREKYESPAVGSTEAYVNYTLAQGSGDVTPEDRVVPVCLKGDDGDEHTTVLCYMTLPVKATDGSNEDYLAAVEDQLSLTLAVQYVRDCEEEEKRAAQGNGNTGIFIDDF